MSSDFLTLELHDPNSIPSYCQTQRIFWDCLSKAEHTFGPRGAGWEYTVSLRKAPPFPETINDGRSQVTVWLTLSRSWVGYYYEAAHEAVHCLNPIVPSGTAMYIEEAVATSFGLEVVRGIFGQDGVDKCGVTTHYRRPIELASEIDVKIIRLGQRLREHVGALERVTVGTFRELYPNAPNGAVLRSLERFPRL